MPPFYFPATLCGVLIDLDDGEGVFFEGLTIDELAGASSISEKSQNVRFYIVLPWAISLFFNVIPSTDIRPA